MATFRQTNQGTWHVQIRRKGYPVQTRTFDLRAEADKWARQIESEMDRGLYIDRGEAEKNTLYDILDRYAREVSPTKRGAATECARIEYFKEQDFAKIKMAALSSKHLAAWRDKRLKAVSGSTVNRELNILSAAINRARKEWGIHSDNPVALLSRPKENRGRERRLIDDEEKRLLEKLDCPPRENGKIAGPQNTWIRPLVLFALETAMRRGELLGLRWEHVDLNRRVAHLPLTKNGESRDVPLSRAAIDVLRDLPRSIDGRVFPITADALKKAFTRACKRAEIDDLHFHDLRHEATSRLALRVPNVILLARITGHKDLKMLNRYYHVTAETLAEMIG